MAGKSSGKLKVTTRGDKEILLDRVFDAPRHLVWEAMSNAEHVRRWWCCMDGYTMPVCDMDFRVGGKWRYVMRSTDGTDVGFYGEYLEIVEPKRIVNTEIYDPFPDAPATCTVTLEEKDGKTYFQNVVVHSTAEGRDAHVNSGMEFGANIAFDRIEQIAQELDTSAAGTGMQAASGAGTSGAPAPREI
jgi:uncharacterized protein YndB with AHSA1/START domain